MSEGCQFCKFAEWDYVSYYNTTQKQWFICDCMKEKEFLDGGKDCEEFEEGEYE